jgi:FkbM family methyltransferase
MIEFPLSMLSRWVRALLSRFDYVLWKREFLVYGVLPFHDINRLSHAWYLPIETCFDVGANTGQTAREMLEEFPFARVYSFEPHPVSCERLREIMNPRFSAHMLALSDQCGEVPFYEYAATGGGSHVNSLLPNSHFPSHFRFSSGAKKITAQSTTIDTFCEQHSIEKIDVLKLDIEGSELAALEGARGMLERGRIRFVYTEYTGLVPTAGVAGGSLMPIATYLDGFGLVPIATYTDYVLHKEKFVVANALFALWPSS